MELLAFFAQVEGHPDLQGLGTNSNTQYAGRTSQDVIIKHTPSGLITSLHATTIQNTEWPTLEEVLTGKREPQVLRHMARVVGYFSRVENWNKSKIGELKDRHKGTYSLA
ncbi:MAG: anaerobic ribonucleoside-triphosphate reductase [Oscillospiraceae bacterium]|nr:anaerobic ribonucleoside-triphosphate reductase [Oscillospiraceae bacterium]